MSQHTLGTTNNKKPKLNKSPKMYRPRKAFFSDAKQSSTL
jgi:hypothetical protein